MDPGFKRPRDFSAGVAGNHGQDSRKRKSDTWRKSLDLTLHKTPELLERIEASVDEEDERYTTIRKYKSQPAPERLKACNFPARKIQIGNWERRASNDNDIVVKFYFKKKQMVWEVMVGQKKKKIEISWSDVSALRATFAEGEPSTLHVEPRKHPAWTTTQDFTSGEAIKYRRHTLTFSEGILKKHYEKIVHINGWLFHKHRRPFPAHNSPLFDVVQKNDTPLNHRQCAYILTRERANPTQQRALMVHPLRQLPPELPPQSPPFPRSIVSPNLRSSSVIGNMDLSSPVNNRGLEVPVRVQSTPAPNVYLKRVGIDPQTQYCAQDQALHANAIPAGSSLNEDFRPSSLMPTGAYNQNEAQGNPMDEGISLRNPTDFSHANGLPDDFILMNDGVHHNLDTGDISFGVQMDQETSTKLDLN